MPKRVTKIGRSIGQKVKQLREAKGWSINQLGLYAGVTPSTIARMEKGESEPPISTLLRIAKALNVSLEELLSESEQIKLGDEELVSKEYDIYEIIEKTDNLMFKGTPVNTPEIRQAIIEAITFALKLKEKENNSQEKKE
ncbi:helix-turn-helix domain-containing protein [Anaerocellum danielii]|uniref:Helix-turn-helix transcriptional regulator n=1 Tax=Anaerocellum danielii TaxID=1387557 RepID=A0ABZ0TYC9_9FIRM|nr:helix-turn-helix transcriptional regulator [Caldicellulosiruptor danielii]WPX08227.1 helix-turn-helix transcriptional regulator [Caldicellulosiruptor danielii]